MNPIPDEVSRHARTDCNAGVVPVAEKEVDKPGGLQTKERLAADRPAILPQQHSSSVPQSHSAPNYLPDNTGATKYPSLAGKLQKAKQQHADSIALKKEESNRPDKHGRMPLMMAAERGDTKMIGSLLEQGAALTQADSQGNTALFYAAKGGNSEAVRLLAQGNPALVSQRNKAGETAATVAAKNGKGSALTVLIYSRANPYEVSGGKALLIHALTSGSKETVHRLVQELKLRDSGPWRAHHASQLFSYDKCEDLGKALLDACQFSIENKCDSEITRMLLEEGRHHLSFSGQQFLMELAQKHQNKTVADALRKLFPALY